MKITEHWIKGSDNAIRILLYENDVLLSGAWTEVQVTIGHPTAILTLTRSADGNGISFSSGTLQIIPAQLTPAELTSAAELAAGNLYRVLIRIKSTTNPNGVDFGFDDSDDQVYFLVHERAA